MLQKDHVSIIGSCMRSSLVGKSAQTSAVYKLIMFSRVPSYGQFEYLEVDSYVSHHSLINVLGLMMILG